MTIMCIRRNHNDLPQALWPSGLQHGLVTTGHAAYKYCPAVLSVGVLNLCNLLCVTWY